MVPAYFAWESLFKICMFAGEAQGAVVDLSNLQEKDRLAVAISFGFRYCI